MTDTSSPRLPEKPSWFDTTFTSWSFPHDIPCTKSVPRKAIDVGTVDWAFAPGLDRTDRYKLSKNPGTKHLILWGGCPNESGRGWIYTPGAYGPAQGTHGETINEWHAALHLLVAIWMGEKEELELSEPPQEVYGLLAGNDFQAVCREVWPEYWEEGGRE